MDAFNVIYHCLEKSIILQLFDDFKTEIRGSQTKYSAVEGSRGHLSNVAE